MVHDAYRRVLPTFPAFSGKPATNGVCGPVRTTGAQTPDT
jgi:hypothetical protein